MQKNSTGYMYMFALVITLGCGVLLAIVSEFTKVDRLTNIKVEKMTNILSTVNYTFDKEATNEEIETAYKQYIEEKVVNTNGEFIEGNAFELLGGSQRKVKPLRIGAAELEARLKTNEFPSYTTVVENERDTSELPEASGDAAPLDGAASRRAASSDQDRTARRRRS